MSLHFFWFWLSCLSPGFTARAAGGRINYCQEKKTMRLLKAEVTFELIDGEESLPEALRSLATFLEKNKENIDKPSISSGLSHHSFVWNNGLGVRAMGKASVFELRNGGKWVRVDDTGTDTFICR
jgi:hypothetical protein